MVGTPISTPVRGKAYVYHGTALGLTPAFDWPAAGGIAMTSLASPYGTGD